MADEENNPVFFWLFFLKDGIYNGDPTAIGIFVALVVVLFTIGNFCLSF